MHTTPLVARSATDDRGVIQVGAELIGSDRLAIIAGPCSVESRDQVLATARAVKSAGARFLRGGAYKPRTSPYSFQGLKEQGLELLAEARAETGLQIVTEVMDARHIEIVSRVADVLQVGSRNMQNFTLLDELGKLDKPILLKRGMCATIDEFLCAAERIASAGNTRIILCERGIRTFDSEARNTLDLNAVPMLKRRSCLPLIVDPSHGTGHDWMVPHLSRAAVAAGCDGLLIEVHDHPEKALCDGAQSLTPDGFEQTMTGVREVAAVMGRTA